MLIITSLFYYNVIFYYNVLLNLIIIFNSYVLICIIKYAINMYY